MIGWLLNTLASWPIKTLAATQCLYLVRHQTHKNFGTILKLKVIRHSYHNLGKTELLKTALK